MLFSMSKKRRRTKLVQNTETKTPKTEMLKLTLNLLPKSCRFDTLEGQDYTVVPMVILTEGVHSGSLGQLYYPEDELAKTPQVWNHKPVVVYHPSRDGVGVSACDPTIINSRKVGLMMNTRFEGGKLKSEAWIRKDRAAAVDDRIMTAIDEGEMMELSTGVFVDVDDTEGTFKGEDYVGVARNYRPDHLALLPDQIGACSISDGAGFLRNAEHGLSHSDVHVQLDKLLTERFGGGGANLPIVFVRDTFSNFVIYENNGTFFRLGYTSNDTEVQLSDEQPVEVVRVSEYRTVNNQTKETNNMEKETKKMVDAVVGNAKWSDEDLKTLSEFPKDRLAALAEIKKEFPDRFQVSLSAETLATNTDGEGVKAPVVPALAPTPQPVTPTPVPAPAKNAEQGSGEPVKEPTTAEYIAQAPKEIREVLYNGVQSYNEEKVVIIATIVKNENNTFTKEELDNKPINELRKMARLMGAKLTETVSLRTANYAGQAPTPTDNVEVGEPMVMAVMDFAKK